jgi:predicted small lipoprotein YifL
MRKYVFVIALTMTAASLSACGAKAPADGNGSSAAVESTVETTEETTESIGESAADAVEETSSEANASETELDKIHQAVKDAYGDKYIPSMEISTEELDGAYGITPDLYEEHITEGPMISVHVDLFLGFKAAEGKADELEQRLNDYRDMLLDNSLQYPSNISKIEASEVVRHDDYVFFIMLGTASEEALNQGEEAALESSMEENKKAIDAIDNYFK